MSHLPKDVVEAYFDSVLGQTALEPDCAQPETGYDNEIALPVPKGISPSIQTPISRHSMQSTVMPTATLARSLVTLDDTSELEEGRKAALQALLTRQILTQVSPHSEANSTHVGQISESSTPVKSKQINQQVAKAHQQKNDQSAELPGDELQATELKKNNSIQEPPESWCENGRPIWAQSQFSALLFKVSGLTLAVPLVSLGQIHLISDKLTPIFGQADWFMGLQETAHGRVKAVNTALFIMPERYNPEFLLSAKYVVSIMGLNWGLAVDEVQQPTRINPDDVTWRTQRGKRPWLAGTVKSAMCALLDVPQLAYALECVKSQSEYSY